MHCLEKLQTNYAYIKYKTSSQRDFMNFIDNVLQGIKITSIKNNLFCIILTSRHDRVDRLGADQFIVKKFNIGFILRVFLNTKIKINEQSCDGRKNY